MSDLPGTKTGNCCDDVNVLPSGVHGLGDGGGSAAPSDDGFGNDETRRGVRRGGGHEGSA